MSSAMSVFAETIYQNKYAHQLNGTVNRKEVWAESAGRVANSVMDPYLPHLTPTVRRFIEERKLMPGGRYLASAGRKFPQVNNCLSGSTKVVTDKGVRRLEDLVGLDFKVLNRHGEWEDATAHSFGVQKLFKVNFTNGDYVWATAGHRWWQADGTRVTTAELQRCPLTRTAVVPDLNEEAIRHGIIYGDGQRSGKNHTKVFLCTEQKRTLARCFTDEEKSVTVGGGSILKFRTHRQLKAGLCVALQAKHYKDLPGFDGGDVSPSYARGFIAGLIATDGSTRSSSVTISCTGMDRARKIRDLAVLGGCVVSGIRTNRNKPNYIKGKLVRSNGIKCIISLKPFSAPLIRADQMEDLAKRKLQTTKMWLEVESIEADEAEEVYCCVVPGSESFTLANGLISSNCALFSVEDSREGWAGLMNKITSTLMTGAGIGVVYSKLRREGAGISGLGGNSTGPCALMQMVNEAGRHIMQGGSRRSAIWAGLHWHHPDVFKFIKLKDWSDAVRTAKEDDYNAQGCMDGTNISIILDDDFFEAYKDPTWVMHYKLGGENYKVDHNWACDVYWQVIRHMLQTGEPGFSVDTGDNSGEHLRNAPVHGDTRVLTYGGYEKARDLEGVLATVWTGKQWAKDVLFKKTGSMVPTVKVRMSNGSFIVCDPSHPFVLSDDSRVAAGRLNEGDKLTSSMLHESGVQVIRVLSVTPDEPADVYCADVGVEEHSFCAEGVLVSNCTEVSSRDDSDICNLASINMARISSIEEMAEVTEAGTALLLCGTLYSKLPTEQMYRIREKNRRLGLGLMGVHEWLLRRGKRYEPDDELGKWLEVYARSGSYANRYADKLSISRPVATRAIAPTGTISIVAETTSGIEPIYAVAFKRRYLDGKEWKAQYVIDATAERLIADGVDHNLIEDAVTLAEDVERRMRFQAWTQQWVDHGISSTINLPPWGTPLNNESKVTSFGQTLLKYLPQLRGITAYPDGSRGGQPLTRVPYEEAKGQVGVEFVDNAEMGCKSGVCGS